MVQLSTEAPGTQVLVSDYSGTASSGGGLTISSSTSYGVTDLFPNCQFGNGTGNASLRGSPISLGDAIFVATTWSNTGTITLYTYDLTAQTSQTPQTTTLSGSFPATQGWTVGGSSLSAKLGRIFILPHVLSETELDALATAAT